MADAAMRALILEGGEWVIAYAQVNEVACTCERYQRRGDRHCAR